MDFKRYEPYESLVLRIFLGLTLIFWGYEKLTVTKLTEVYPKDYGPFLFVDVGTFLMFFGIVQPLLGTTVAGSSGYYQVRLHLHNSELGKKLVLHSEAGQKDLIVKFDPDNMTTERTAEVNFGKVPPSSGLGTYTLLGGSTLLLAAVIYAVSRKRKSRQQPRGKKKQRTPNI